MFKRQTNVVMDVERSSVQNDRLDEIIRSIDGLIFSIKMDSYKSLSAQRGTVANKALEYTNQELMAKKNILFNLIPKEELFALTKRKVTAAESLLPLN